MAKIVPHKPLLILLYGFPGSGKTFFANQLGTHMQVAHVEGDRIRAELFEKPRYDKQENEIIAHLMNYMSEEFLSAGISVVYDTNALRISQRHYLRELARKAHAQPFLVWFQMDAESAYARNIKRDRRRSDDRFAAGYDRNTFGAIISSMQNPTPAEEYVVVSGKHTFNTQYSAFNRRLRDLGLLGATDVNPVVKPGLVNLVPHPPMIGGRVDPTRRNISIR